MSKNYRLTVVYVFEAIDDPEARDMASILASDAQPGVNSVKLQEIYDAQPPRHVNFSLNKQVLDVKSM